MIKVIRVEPYSPSLDEVTVECDVNDEARALLCIPFKKGHPYKVGDKVVLSLVKVKP